MHDGQKFNQMFQEYSKKSLQTVIKDALSRFLRMEIVTNYNGRQRFYARL